MDAVRTTRAVKIHLEICSYVNVSTISRHAITNRVRIEGIMSDKCPVTGSGHQ